MSLPEVARPSIMSLFLTMTWNGQGLAVGTGFLVEDQGRPYLVTNRHNLSGRHPETNAIVSHHGVTPDAVTIRHNRAAALGQWVEVSEPVVDEDENPLWFEHPTWGRQVDVVVLPLTRTEEVDIYTYALTPHPVAAAPGVSDGVNIIGFPFGITSWGSMGVWSRGTLASEPGLDYEGLPRFLIDSRTRKGQSGSPVITYYSGGWVPKKGGGTAVMKGPVEMLLGVYSGRINAQSDLGFVWKTRVIREILAGRVQNAAT